MRLALISLTVTKEDITLGTKASDACPIALAANRTIGKETRVYYSFYKDRKKGWLLVPEGTDKVRIFKLPTAVAIWAEAFDRTGKGKPFEFNIPWKG